MFHNRQSLHLLLLSSSALLAMIPVSALAKKGHVATLAAASTTATSNEATNASSPAASDGAATSADPASGGTPPTTPNGDQSDNSIGGVEAAMDGPADGTTPDGTLGAIVVTATKRTTNLQDTPIAMSVLNSDGLTDRHVESLNDLRDGTIPSLRIATFEARTSALQVGIRGIVSTDANQPAREGGVGIYIDGVYLGRPQGLSQALLDVDRIEVLKGPQGTLFGRNAVGGAISIVPKAPSGNLHLRQTFGVANYGGYNSETHLDLPSLGQLAFKFDAVFQHRGSIVKNRLANQRGWDRYNRRGGRGAVRWTPADKLTFDLAGDYGWEATTPVYSQLLNKAPNAVLPSMVEVSGNNHRMKESDIGVPQQNSIGKQWGVSLHSSWKAMRGLELRSITAYRHLTQSQWDNSGGAHRPPLYKPNGLFSRYSLADLKQHQFSEELQALGKISRVQYVLGLYYFSERARDSAWTPNTNKWNANGTGYIVLPTLEAGAGTPFPDRASIAYARSFATFGQLDWNPAIWGDRIHIIAGARYTHDKRHGRLLKLNGVDATPTFHHTANRVNPMVTLQIDPVKGVNTYFRYATAYRSGGANSRSLTYRSFGPEDLRSYELGLKTEFWDHKARFNIAGYISRLKHMQIDFSSVPGSPQLDGNGNVILGPNGQPIVSNRNTVETMNAPGTTKIKGVEVDAALVPLKNLTLNFAYAYTHTRVPDTLNPFTKKTQSVFIVFTPRNALSGGFDYTVPMKGFDVRLHMDIAYSGRARAFEQEDFYAQKSTLVNGRLAIANISAGPEATLTIAAWARNLFNKKFIYRRSLANRATLGDYGNFNQPRFYGLDAVLKF